MTSPSSDPGPGICLVLTGPTLNHCRAQLRAHRSCIDLAELRADLIDPVEWPQLNAFSQQTKVPLILTLRQPQDGGQWTGSVESRRAFFERALEGRWTWIDLEESQRLPDIEKAWLAQGGRLIISFHDFEGVSVGWTERVLALEAPGIIPKVALYPQSSLEFEAFTQAALSLPSGRRVILAMGPFGFASRILAARYGSAWTYATPPGMIAAPGQIEPEVLQGLYRFHEQTKETPVYGIVGNPVYHSKSPAIHNPALSQLGLPGTYVPFLVDDLASFFRTADLLQVQGLSCTIPFKEDVLLFLRHSSDAVKATGACNTLWRQSDATWAGDNTDAPGFLRALDDVFGEDLSDVRATVVGTGGAARGITWALCQAGAKVLVLGRTPDKAQALAVEFGAEWAPLGPEARLVVEDHSDLLVQTTSVGMGDTEGQDPLDWYEFTGREVAYDIIYAPQWTTFLTRAEEAGCQVLFGQDMLIGQAIGQFKRFTGRELPMKGLKLPSQSPGEGGTAQSRPRR